MKKFLRYSVIVLVVASLPITIIGINIYAYMEWAWVQRMESTGIKVDARVVSREVIDANRGSYCNATFRYLGPASQDSVTQEVEVDEALYRLLETGGTWAVRLDPDDPNEMHVVGNETYWMMLIYAVVGDLLLIILGITIYRIYRKSKQPAGMKP